jgi:hypothetical protein
MKWSYHIETSGTAPDETKRNVQMIDGEVYGGFADALTQVERALIHHGWQKNTAPVTIKLRPTEDRG